MPRKPEKQITEKQAKAALGRLKKGETTLIAESDKLGFSHNGPLRAALKGLLGDKGYRALMAGRGPAKKKPAKKKAASKKKPAAKKKAASKTKAAGEKRSIADEKPTATVPA